MINMYGLDTENVYTKEEVKLAILNCMDRAAREDRKRFFEVADTLVFQPKYAGRLEELEVLKQTWRDLPASEGYPNIDWPPLLPEWFPKVHFASSWNKDEYVDQETEGQLNSQEI